MLTLAQASAGPRAGRPQPSLRQQYQEYLLQRIEGYKNSLPREELLRLGDEAATELQAASEGQFVLTEVLMRETVDRLIMKRLGLGSYSRWRKRFLKLREAQQEPTHWGIEAHHPVVTVLPRLEQDDRALVIGAGAEPLVYLLAAFDADVTFVAGSLGRVERVETRIASESLASRFQAFVAQLGEWLPPTDDLGFVIIDAAELAELELPQRRALLADLQARTLPEGVHLIIAGEGGVPPEGYLSHYPDWQRQSPPKAGRGSRGAAQRGLLLVAPRVRSTQASQDVDVSIAHGS